MLTTNNKKNIILTHWAGSEDKQVYVNSALSKYVQNYHLLQLRFIYSRYKNKFKGSVLNCPQDMVCPITISAFLSTFTKLPNPVLILSTACNLKYWIYFLSLIPQANLQRNASTKDLKTKDDNLVILLGTSIELFHEYDQYSIIILDNAEDVIKTRTKRADFNIAITHRNFYKKPDDNLLWSIFNWSNIYAVGNFLTFSGKYNELLDNHIEPYPSIFLRITWDFCKSFKKIDLQLLQNEINNNLVATDFDVDDNNTKKHKNTNKKSSVSKKMKTSVKTSPSDECRKTTKAHFFEENGNVSYEIENPKTPEFKDKNSLKPPNSSKLNIIDEEHFISSDSIDGCDYDSVLSKIMEKSEKYFKNDFSSRNIQSPVLELSKKDNIDILSQMFDKHKEECYGNSVMDKIMDSEYKAVDVSIFDNNSDDSNGQSESVLSKLFP